MYTLNCNGIKCNFLEVKEPGHENIITLILTVRCGTTDSELSKKECAHLLEHILMSFDKIGSTRENYIYAKAETSYFYTSYYITCEISKLSFALEIVKSLFKKTYINENNMKIAINEILNESSKLFNDYDSNLRKNIFILKGSIFEKYHPNYQAEASVNCITLYELMAFHNKWYYPSNTMLNVVVGTDYNHNIYNQIKIALNQIANPGFHLRDYNLFRLNNVCNCEVYDGFIFSPPCKMKIFYEIKQSMDYLDEKIEKNFFFEVIKKFIYEYFKRISIDIIELHLSQFENCSFILSLSISERVDYENLIKNIVDFIYLNKEILIIEIEKLHDINIVEDIPKYLVNQFAIKSFAYFENISDAEHIVKKISKILKNFDIAKVKKILQDLMQSKYKVFIE